MHCGGGGDRQEQPKQTQRIVYSTGCVDSRRRRVQSSLQQASRREMQFVVVWPRLASKCSATVVVPSTICKSVLTASRPAGCKMTSQRTLRSSQGWKRTRAQPFSAQFVLQIRRQRPPRITKLTVCWSRARLARLESESRQVEDERSQK
jgi:hypothetical protein